MSTRFEDEVARNVAQGYQVIERLSPTSVVLRRTWFFVFTTWLFVWLDEHSNVQVSRQSVRVLTKRLAEKVRAIRILEAKVSWTDEIIEEGRPSDPFDILLAGEYDLNVQMLKQTEAERASLEKEIGIRNCLGKIREPLKAEVQRCLQEGYELSRHTDSTAVLLWRTLGGMETLNFGLDSGGALKRTGSICTQLQGRLDALISLFKFYRTQTPPPGRDRQFLDKQFELDAKINALHGEMEYLGHTPDLGDYTL